MLSCVLWLIFNKWTMTCLYGFRETHRYAPLVVKPQVSCEEGKWFWWRWWFSGAPLSPGHISLTLRQDSPSLHLPPLLRCVEAAARPSLYRLHLLCLPEERRRLFYVLVSLSLKWWICGGWRRSWRLIERGWRIPGGSQRKRQRSLSFSEEDYGFPAMKMKEKASSQVYSSSQSLFVFMCFLSSFFSHYLKP